MRIKIENYKKFLEGKTRGIADISIFIDNVPLTIRGVRVVESSSTGHFYALPQKEYKTEEGEKKYSPICVFFSKDGYQTFHSAMNSAFTEYFKTNTPDIIENKSKKSVFNGSLPISNAGLLLL